MVVAVSNYVKNSIIKFYGIDPEKVVVIYNGVDTNKFKPDRNKKKKNVAIWVGTDPVLKGLKSAINYASSKKMKLIVVGMQNPGKESNEIDFKGRIEYNEMPKLYNSADTLLFFSKCEGHPLVPLEAMACGLNILASKESHIEIIPIKGNFYRIDKRNARNVAKKYDWKIQARKYIKLYKTLED